MSAKEVYAEIKAAETQLEAKKREAHAEHLREQRARPLLDRLVFSAHSRCPCGAGLAYDPAAEDEPGSPFYGPTAWDCSAIMLGTAAPKGEPGAVKHTDKLPFAFYEIKSENQPSAGGATMRPTREAA